MVTGTEKEVTVQENIKRLRLGKGLTRTALGTMIGKSESAVKAYETGKTDIPLSALAAFSSIFGVTLAEIVSPPQEEKPPEKKAPIELIVYEQGDRLMVAQLLIKNGYTIGSGKRKKTPTGKVVEYYLKVYGGGETPEED